MNWRYGTVLFITHIGLAACGGSDTKNNPATQSENLALSEYSKLEKSHVEPVHLEYATEESLLNHLKNGIRLNVHFFPTRTDVDDGGTPEPVATPAAEVDAFADTSSGSGNFSSTNTHVTGVDEADYIKYDGEHIYLATSAVYSNEDYHPPGIRILETDPSNALISEVGAITIGDDDAWGSVGALYLNSGEDNDQDLITIRTQYSYNRPMFTDGDALIAPSRESIEITTFSVNDPQNPSQKSVIKIDGYLNSSRKIGNTLYVVANYFPYLPNIQYYFSEDDVEGAEANETRIASLTLAELLPKIQKDDEDPTTFLSANRCLIPVDTNQNSGYASLTSIIAIDLSTSNIISANCLNAYVQGLYVNQDSLFIGGSRYQAWNDYNSTTVIHKFKLQEQIAYASTGIVPGWLGWRSPSFRMDEHNDHLRVLTTDSEWGVDPEHYLHILRDSRTSDEMEIISRLPNEAQPEAIGKQGEDVYSVRFVGDKAYVVTFRRIDPLYVLDLADENAPSISGELEIPGFSTYLHPIGDNYLLGVGQDATDEGLTQGVKVSLFNIENMDNPMLVNSLTFGERGTWSPALYDLHALTFLRATDDQLRFTLPINSYADNWEWLEDALHLFEINGLSNNTASLDHAGRIISEEAGEEKSWSWFSGIDRSVLHDDAVYYAHGNQVWGSFWQSPESATGPH